MEQAFQEKWSRALSPRWLQTTCALLRVSGAPGGSFLSRITGKLSPSSPAAALVRAAGPARSIPPRRNPIHGRQRRTSRNMNRDRPARPVVVFGLWRRTGCFRSRVTLILGHALSPRDFGIAASITLLLQLVETLSDLGHDRLIVQAEDGDSERFLGHDAHHSRCARRPTWRSCLLVLAAPAAQFFAIPEAAGAFALVALVPVIKGFDASGLPPRAAALRQPPAAYSSRSCRRRWRCLRPCRC